MCLFCDIASGKIPCKKVYEDDFVLAFLDLNPINPGHTLVIPKKHYDNFLDIAKDDAEKLSDGILVVINILKNKLHVENVNLLNNSGLDAGQTVMHCHVHVIPRHKGDGFSIPAATNSTTSPSLDEVLDILNK